MGLGLGLERRGGDVERGDAHHREAAVLELRLERRCALRLGLPALVSVRVSVSVRVRVRGGAGGRSMGVSLREVRGGVDWQCDGSVLEVY